MSHVPVLLAEAVELLAPERGGVFVDCTVGAGGHAAALLEAGPAALRLIGVDRDPQALEAAARRLRPFGGRARLLEGDFAELETLLERLGVGEVAGLLADLGVSSLQLETAERGFSFRLDGPLDMRMGAGERTAAEVVNGYSEAELERILRDYGEERSARSIARRLVAARPLATTTELRRVVAGAAAGGRHRIDPATRVFQALRIEVNGELAALARLMEQSPRLLAIGGRLVVISYHSLEDRIVKNALRNLATGRRDPVTGQPLPGTRLFELLTRKPLRPSPAEVAANRRARSARLRAARRLAA